MMYMLAALGQSTLLDTEVWRTIKDDVERLRYAPADVSDQKCHLCRCPITS